MGKLSDVKITRAIIDTYTRRLLNDLELDVAICGGGPAGLLAAHLLADKGHKVALFEKKLSLGGGMWGGGMGFNVIVIQRTSLEILQELGVRYKEYSDGYYTAGSIETVAALIAAACRSGVSIYNLMSVEDVMINEGEVCGIVINSSAIESTGLHVDPVSISAKYVVEATGHPLEVLKKVQEKTGIKLATPSGRIEGERSMNAELGERAVVENTIEIAPGLFVTGMAANAAMGACRMGPVFGGMLLSGQKVAEDIDGLL